MKRQAKGSALACSQGIVLGHVQKLSSYGVLVPERHLDIGQGQHEIARFSLAIQQASAVLQHEYEHIREYPDVAMVLKTHLMLIADQDFQQAVISRIRDELINAEWALQKQIRKLCRTFEAFDDVYLREKGRDIEQVGSRIMRCISGSESGEEVLIESGTILLTDDISPSEVIRLWRMGLAGLLSRQGGSNSHAIIVARGIGLPMLAGVNDVFDLAEEGDAFVLDAEASSWTLCPSASTYSLYAKKCEALAIEQLGLGEFAGRESKSADGYHLPLMVNLEFNDEVDRARSLGAEGIGLFRTEFLLMQSEKPLSESEQFNCYSGVVRGMQGKPVTFRLLDMGGDKISPSMDGVGDLRCGDNPAMGKRGVRLLLDRLDLLSVQLRALVRAAAHGPVYILIPMVTQCEEVTLIRNLVRRCSDELGLESPKVGTMIEVPAAVMIADELAKVSDFFSIGTNDLIQYTLAADRSDEEVSATYTADHPAILKMIQLTVAAAKQAGIPVSICGELAANPLWTETFLRLDMDSLSMSASQLLLVRRQLSLVSHQSV
ncbi:MAG: phosphoenolpyruvate--protein phosphotransferase [Zetaproteobacteria bacterium CG1_02_49_23]|nr:MAG: phosphoenolpyruvate--protein phosphotransferase [Zetaproteobacteria bacterium CG1_02_49_23]